MTEVPSAIAALAARRVEYGRGEFNDVSDNPYDQFVSWYDAAAAALAEPNAMILATADATGPSARTVLLKSMSPAGLTFFTNYSSLKGEQIAGSPRAAVVFPWHEMHRQVRVRAVAEKVPDADSDEYFAVRERGAQIGAWASAQSHPVPDRSRMEENYARYESEFAGGPVPRPPHWGGYLLRPFEVEFWQGQANRFHDRFVYTTVDGAPGDLSEAVGWTITRLDP